jgi:hypothetical protein
MRTWRNGRVSVALAASAGERQSRGPSQLMTEASGQRADGAVARSALR